MSSISGNYPTPVIVNGFSCKNCTDVSLATKHIDPAHPKSGPYGIDVRNDPTVRQDAVRFGGSLTGPSSGAAADTQADGGEQPGRQVDLFA